MTRHSVENIALSIVVLQYYMLQRNSLSRFSDEIGSVVKGMLAKSLTHLNSKSDSEDESDELVFLCVLAVLRSFITNLFLFIYFFFFVTTGH